MMNIKKIIPDPSVSATIRLNYPLNLADRTAREVTMRRPSLGDLLDYEPKRTDDVEGEAVLIGILCGLRIEELRGLDSTDYERLQMQYLRFRAVPEQEADKSADNGALPANPVELEGNQGNDLA